jgi:hypothetical protein
MKKEEQAIKLQSRERRNRGKRQMSSSVHHPKEVHHPKDLDAKDIGGVFRPRDLDAVLMYAPPRARKAASDKAASNKTASRRPIVAPPVESPPTSPELKDSGPIFVGDRAMLALRRQLSLDPEIVPVPPALMNGGPPLEKMALRFCIVAGIAALGAWAAFSLTSKPAGNDIPTAPAPIAAVMPTPAPVVATTATTSVKLVHVSDAAAPPLPTAMALPALPAALATQNELQPRPETPAPAPAPQQLSQPQPATATVVLGADEIAMLLKRGKADLADGDISAARLLLRRAADAGSAEAALTLGSTYDPLVIARLGAFGVQADAAKAREWYQKAAALGSDLAAAQLAKLANGSE